MKQKVTIRDVAKYAGVSAATVSYVINGVNKVSGETKERVLKAIKELNYHPDFTAISLSKKKSNMLGVMIPLVDDSLAPVFKGNHYYSELISGIEYVSRKRGYDFLISGIGKPEDCKGWVTKRNLDGLIFLNSFPQTIFEEMKALSIPLALIDTYEEYAGLYHNIRIDDEQGGYLAAKHLIELGHRSLGFVAPVLGGAIDGNRVRGFKRAMREANLSLNEHHIIEAKESSFEKGYEIGLQMARSNEEVTGVFVSSDILALGMIKALKECQKEVPDDYSVVGFDDLIISMYASPSLTTIRQDVFQKGVIAAQTLIDAIEGNVRAAETITLPVELVVRGSTKKMNQKV
ncbi:LacI family transcriptional regulator [Bacillus fengqiuensis]|nr:LacI family transcriptional regulator [Bacillus fengqiuensis]